MSAKSTRQGLQSIRTQTSRRATATLKKHELYMKLTSLEIERARRTTERDALVQRLRMLEERIAVIVADQTRIEQEIDQSVPNTTGDGQHPRSGSGPNNFCFQY